MLMLDRQTYRRMTDAVSYHKLPWLFLILLATKENNYFLPVSFWYEDLVPSLYHHVSTTRSRLCKSSPGHLPAIIIIMVNIDSFLQFFYITVLNCSCIQMLYLIKECLFKSNTKSCWNYSHSPFLPSVLAASTQKINNLADF